MSTFANGMAINIVLQAIKNRHWALNLYGNFCLVMTLVGALSYAWYQSAAYYERHRFPEKLPDEYYGLSWLCGALASFVVSLNPEALNGLLYSCLPWHLQYGRRYDGFKRTPPYSPAYSQDLSRQ